MAGPRRSRAWVACAVLLALLAAVLVLGVAVGGVPIRPGTTVSVLAHRLLGTPAGDWKAWEETILVRIRLPRVLVGAMVGGGLALCGAVMQGIFRNPMADPAVIGVSAGAALGAVAAIFLGWAVQSVLAQPALAFAGALGCAFLVYALAARRGQTPVGTLLLSGIAVGSVATSLASFLLSLSLANYDIGRQIVLWLMGGLDARTWLHVKLAAPFVLGGSLLLLAYARDLNAMLTGEESALALGVDVPRVRRNLLILTSLVTAAAVSVSGMVAFVGLVVPHIARMIVGPDHRVLLPASFLAGSSFLVLADGVARTVIAPEELRLGLVTSLVGGPFFVYLLIAHKKRVEGV